MLDGLLIAAADRPLSSVLIADATSGATTLTLDWVGPFPADGGTVSINGTAYRYVTVNDDGDDLHQVLTLTAPGLTTAAAAGDEVTLMNGDQLLSQREAYILVGGADEPIQAIVPHALLAFVPEGAEGDPASPYADPWPCTVTDGPFVELVNVEGRTPITDASTLVGDIPQPAEVPQQSSPTSSPTPVVVPLADYALLKAPTARADTVLDLYVTDNPASPIDATTRVASGTRQIPFPLRTLPDGTPLVPGQQYYAATWAFNSGGRAPAPSAWVPFALVPLGDESIEELSVSKLAAGDFTADMGWFGTARFGLGMVLDENGLAITKPNGRKTILAADPTIANQIAGQLLADAADFSDNVSIRGLNNYLAGRLVAGTGVSDPRSKPVVTFDWVTRAVNATASTGMGYRPRGLLENGTTFLYTESLFLGGSASVNAIDKSDWTRASVKSLGLFQPIGGVTKTVSAGVTTFYVLGQDKNRDDGWYVFVFDSAWTKTGEWAVPINLPNGGAIGVDGNSILIARVTNASLLVITMHSATTGAVTDTLTCTTWSGEVTSVTKTAAGFSGIRYVVSTAAGIRVYDTAGNRSSEEWPRAANIYGLAHDGSVWHSQDGLDQVADYTNLVGTYTAGFTWYDNQTAGTGTAETKISDVRAVRMARQRMTVALPSPPPDDGTTDGANTARLYVATSLGTPYLQTSLPAGTLSATYATILGSGTTPPATNGFANRAGTVGRLSSAATDSLGPLWDLLGNGPGRGGWNRWDTTGKAIDQLGLRGAGVQNIPNSTATLVLVAGTVDHDGGGLSYASSVVTVNVAGTYTISGSITYDYNMAGRRTLRLETFTGSAAVGTGTNLVVTEVAIAAGTTVVEFTRDFTLTAGQKLRLVAAQTSGATVPIGSSGAAVSTFDFKRIG